ncbi:hypothetical protein ACFLT9_11840, partial [Acidobacteriota bacterium]
MDSERQIMDQKGILDGKLFNFFIRIQDGKVHRLRAIILLYVPTTLLFISSLYEGTTFSLPNSDGMGFFDLYSFLSTMIYYPIIIFSSSVLILRFSNFIKSSHRIIDFDEFHVSNSANKLKHEQSLKDILKNGYLEPKHFVNLKYLFIIIGLFACILTAYNHTIPTEHYGKDFFLSVNYPIAFTIGRIYYLIFWGF